MRSGGTRRETIVNGGDNKMTSHISENAPLSPDQKSKILRVSCELAPVAANPGLFFIGWTRPLANKDFQQATIFGYQILIDGGEYRRWLPGVR